MENIDFILLVVGSMRLMALHFWYIDVDVFCQLPRKVPDKSADLFPDIDKPSVHRRNPNRGFRIDTAVGTCRIPGFLPMLLWGMRTYTG